MTRPCSSDRASGGQMSAADVLAEALEKAPAMEAMAARHDAEMKSFGAYFSAPSVQYGAAQVPMLGLNPVISAANTAMERHRKECDALAHVLVWGVYFSAVDAAKKITQGGG